MHTPQAVATESNTVFFNISASSIVSKYRGDSEKLVRVLFELASYYAPSTIFFDEIDSIIGHRSGTHGSLAEGEHEGSRRMKTELLVQMDGLVASNKDVFVLAASNLPWDLDSAFLRRLEKRVFIPLPEKQGRKEMIRSHLSEFPLAPTFHKDGLFDLFADQTDGFSGSDIKTLCKEVSMRPLRRMLTQLEHKAGSVVDMSLLIKKHPITVDDFRESLSAINQSTDAELCRRHKIWSETHGSR
jgi:katanin p60 ATPase-containing subunit A1